MMSEDDKGLLDRAKPDLMANIDMNGSLLAHLGKRRALTAFQEDDIKNAGPRHSRVDKLLDYLRRGDKHTLDKLYYALVASEQEPVAQHCLQQYTPRNTDMVGVVVGDQVDGQAQAEAAAALPDAHYNMNLQ